MPNARAGTSPGRPVTRGSPRSILRGIDKAGVGFFVARFDLAVPSGYDVPLAFTFNYTTATDGDDGSTRPPTYRAQLFVNGFQFGKVASHLGPQKAFPVPQGILNYHGENWVAVSLWAMEARGAKIDGFRLTLAGTPVVTAYGPVEMVAAPAWKKRDGAY